MSDKTKTDVLDDIPSTVVPDDAPVEPAAISSRVGYGPTNGVERVLDDDSLKVLVDGRFVKASELSPDPVSTTDADHTEPATGEVK